MNNTKYHFVTFANTSYMTSQRIQNQAQTFNLFTSINGKTEHDIPEFINKHRDFINTNKAGYGFWIWKPKIILDSLITLPDNDILVYCDAGIHLNTNSNSMKRLHYYFSQLMNNKYICVFPSSEKYRVKQFTKNDAIMNYCPELNSDTKSNPIMCYAGLMIIKKNDKCIQLIKEWLDLCENYHFIDNSPSNEFEESPKFAGNDCDNGLFNLVLYKHKEIVTKMPEKEVNIYRNGLQYHHLSKEEQLLVDWSLLKDKPFNVKRITPKFYRGLERKKVNNGRKMLRMNMNMNMNIRR